mmetsp:Transcript_17177/g.20986  ORF Transcript_17177/g.20986 Transcript_17177/m.20986 type:complete len:85 (-) Transcript_17177:409-663(-)
MFHFCTNASLLAPQHPQENIFVTCHHKIWYNYYTNKETLVKKLTKLSSFTKLKCCDGKQTYLQPLFFHYPPLQFPSVSPFQKFS